MAAEHEQDQRVVLAPRSIGGGREQLVRRGPRGNQLLALPAGLFAAELVGHPAGRDSDQPSQRALGRAARRLQILDGGLTRGAVVKCPER